MDPDDLGAEGLPNRSGDEGLDQETDRGAYQLSYFLLHRGQAKSLLFKKVDYPLRGRADVFVLLGSHWERASGLSPVMSGRAEWDPSAVPVDQWEVRAFLAAAGWKESEINGTLDSREGQRLTPRLPKPVPAAVTEDGRSNSPN
jgi:hypothetical protein